MSNGMDTITNRAAEIIRKAKLHDSFLRDMVALGLANMTSW